MSFLFYFDMFGVNKNIKILGKEKFNTKFSSILSILLILILAFKFYKIVSKIISKKSYTLKTLNIPDSYNPVNITNFEFSICSVSSDFSSYIEWNKTYTIYFAKINFSDHNYSQFFPINNYCDDQKFNKFTNKSFNNYDYSKCLCYKIENETMIEPDDQFNGINVNQLTIKKNNKDVNKNLILDINYLDYYFDYDKENPFNEYINLFTVPLSDNKSIYQILYLNRLSYIDDAFDYDLFENEGTEKNIYSVSEKSYINIKELEKSDNNHIWSCELKSNLKNIKNEITLFNLDNIYSAFGGFYQLLNFFFSLICISYNEKYLDHQILNCFKSDFQNLNINNIINNSNRNNKDSFELSRVNKSSINNRITIIKKKNNIDFKINKSEILENIYNIFDFKNFIKIYSDINIFKKIIIADDYKLFDLVSYYYTYGFIKDDRYFINKDEKISKCLNNIIENIDI